MAVLNGRLTRSDLNRVFARLLYVQASIHRRGMQNIGVLHALDAAASRVSDQPAALLARHTEHFNTNPNAVPLVVGGVLRIEEEGERGAPASITRFKQACASALAAAADVFFGGGLKPLALTLASVFAIYRFFPGLVAVLVLYNAALISVRYRGLSFGYARGWGLIDSFTSPRVQRALVLIRMGAALAGGLLAGVISAAANRQGTMVFVPTLIIAVVAWFAVRRGFSASRLAFALFPVAWLIAMILQ